MGFYEQLTKNISLLINSSSKNKSQIAREIGVQHSAVSVWLSGKAYPTLENLVKLCQVLDCNYEDILGRL